MLPPTVIKSSIPTLRTIILNRKAILSSGTSLIRTGTDALASVIDTSRGVVGDVVGTVVKTPAPLADLVGYGDSVRSAGNAVSSVIADSTKLTTGAVLRTTGGSIDHAGRYKK